MNSWYNNNLSIEREYSAQFDFSHYWKSKIRRGKHVTFCIVNSAASMLSDKTTYYELEPQSIASTEFTENKPMILFAIRKHQSFSGGREKNNQFIGEFAVEIGSYYSVIRALSVIVCEHCDIDLAQNKIVIH
tara:strand:- start:1116 stop:1511 length:396 start_codon:yes stop_codon:yes gene_type:complete